MQRISTPKEVIAFKNPRAITPFDEIPRGVFRLMAVYLGLADLVAVEKTSQAMLAYLNSNDQAVWKFKFKQHFPTEIFCESRSVKQNFADASRCEYSRFTPYQRQRFIQVKDGNLRDLLPGDVEEAYQLCFQLQELHSGRRLAQIGVRNSAFVLMMQLLLREYSRIIDRPENDAAVIAFRNSSTHSWAMLNLPEDELNDLINQEDPNDLTPLLLSRSGEGYTALHYAVLGNHLQAVRILLKKDIRLLNMATNNRETPIYFAIQNGFDECVKILLEAGALNRENGEQPRNLLTTPLINGDIDLVKMLIHYGVSLEFSPEAYMDDLYCTADQGINISTNIMNHNICMQLLIQYAKKINSSFFEKNTQLLHHAMSAGHVQCSAYLIELGADGCAPSVPNGIYHEEEEDREMTAFHFAARNGKVKLLELLLKYFGSKMVDKLNQGGASPLIDAIEAGNFKFARALIANGVNVNARYVRNRSRISVLHVAYNYTCEILNKGMFSYMPHYEACRSESLNFLSSLLGCESINLNYTNDQGDNLLHMIVNEKSQDYRHGRYKMDGFELLLTSGINPQLRNNSGATPLHVAVQARGLPFVCVLLKHDNTLADIPDHNGITPRQLAESSGNEALVQVFKDAEIQYTLSAFSLFQREVFDPARDLMELDNSEISEDLEDSEEAAQPELKRARH